MTTFYISMALMVLFAMMSVVLVMTAKPIKGTMSLTLAGIFAYFIICNPALGCF